MKTPVNRDLKTECNGLMMVLLPNNHDLGTNKMQEARQIPGEGGEGYGLSRVKLTEPLVGSEETK